MMSFAFEIIPALRRYDERPRIIWNFEFQMQKTKKSWAHFFENVLYYILDQQFPVAFAKLLQCKLIWIAILGQL